MKTGDRQRSREISGLSQRLTTRLSAPPSGSLHPPPFLSFISSLFPSPAFIHPTPPTTSALIPDLLAPCFSLPHTEAVGDVTEGETTRGGLCDERPTGPRSGSGGGGGPPSHKVLRSNPDSALFRGRVGFVPETKWLIGVFSRRWSRSVGAASHMGRGRLRA